MSTVPASIIPGQWVIESFTDTDGKRTDINREVTIAAFNVIQSSSKVINISDNEIWWESYDDLISVNTQEGEKEKSVFFGFSKKKGASVSTANVYEISFTIDDYDLKGCSVFSLTELSYNSSILTSSNTVYSQFTITTVGESQTGILKMKKLR